MMTGQQRPNPFEDPAESVRQDILRNLYNVLNARRGRVVGWNDFGLDDAEDLSKSPQRVADTIKRLIIKFEPRIDPDQLRVTPSDAPNLGDAYDGYFRASFIVQGRMLLPQGKSKAISIRTTVVNEAAQIEGDVEVLDTTLGTQALRPRRVLVESDDNH